MASIRWDIAADHEPYRARGKSSPDLKRDSELREKRKQAPVNTPFSGQSKTNENTKTSNANLSSERRIENSNSAYDAFKISSSTS